MTNVQPVKKKIGSALRMFKIKIHVDMCSAENEENIE